MTRPCSHDGFRSFRSSYDRDRGLLLFFWTCEECGAQLTEAHRSEYRPRFEPRGNERQLDSSR